MTEELVDWNKETSCETTKERLLARIRGMVGTVCSDTVTKGKTTGVVVGRNPMLYNALWYYYYHLWTHVCCGTGICFFSLTRKAIDWNIVSFLSIL